MARIIYALSGQGLGHISRLQLIGQYLLDRGHELLVAASGEAYPHAERLFPGRSHRITGFYFIYRHGGLEGGRTMLENAWKFPGSLARNLRLFKTAFEPFCPDLLITDYEPFSAWWAYLTGVPYLSVDHQHVLTQCRLERCWRDPSEFLTAIPATLITRFYYTGARKYLILNFFKAPTTHPRAELVPPIVRPVILDQVATRGEHLVYYTTDRTLHPEKLPAVLNEFGQFRFRVYGYEQDLVVGNCQFKKFSDAEFVQDLASSRGVIATAGFSLISECLHLRKKMLVLPIHRQYEQIVNAVYLEKLGLGKTAYRLDRKALGAFLEELETPVESGNRILWPDNQAFFQQFERALRENC